MQTLRSGRGVEEKEASTKLWAPPRARGMRGFQGLVAEAAWKGGVCKVNFSYSVLT